MAVQSEDKYRAPALEKGIDILELLAEESGGLSQAEIAKSLGRTANEIYRMLATLERRGYIIKDVQNDHYCLSMKLYSLAHRHSPMKRLLDRALPLMQKAANEIQQSVQLGLLEGGAITIAQVVIPHALGTTGHSGFSAHTGAVAGLYNTGTGRILAAFCPPNRLDEIIDNHRLVPGETLTLREEFHGILEQVRSQGYVQINSLMYYGVVNLVYPVFGPEDGVAIAALGTPYLTRIDNADSMSIEETKKVLVHATQALSASFDVKPALQPA